MGFDKRIMALGIGHYPTCMDGFETLGLGLKRVSLLINSLAMWWVAAGREALAGDTGFTFFQNAQKTAVRGDSGYEL